MHHFSPTSPPVWRLMRCHNCGFLEFDAEMYSAIRNDQLIGSMGQFNFVYFAGWGCWVPWISMTHESSQWVYSINGGLVGKSSMDFPASSVAWLKPCMTSSGRNLQPAGCQSSKVYIAVGCATARHFQVPSGAACGIRANCAGAEIQEFDRKVGGTGKLNLARKLPEIHSVFAQK